MITQITNYLANARKKLPQQDKSQPRIDGVIQSLMAEVQALENAAWDVLFYMSLQNNPTGDLLDKLGALVGQPRAGASDADYTVYISARIQANRSDARHETLLSIVSILTNQTTPIIFRTYLKALEIEVDNVQANPYIIWAQFLNIAKAAGDSLRFFYSQTDKTNVLTRSSVYGGVTTVTTQRKGSIYGSYGGGVFGGVFGSA